MRPITGLGKSKMGRVLIKQLPADELLQGDQLMKGHLKETSQIIKREK